MVKPVAFISGHGFCYYCCCCCCCCCCFWCCCPLAFGNRRLTITPSSPCCPHLLIPPLRITWLNSPCLVYKSLKDRNASAAADSSQLRLFRYADRLNRNTMKIIQFWEIGLNETLADGLTSEFPELRILQLDGASLTRYAPRVRAGRHSHLLHLSLANNRLGSDAVFLGNAFPQLVRLRLSGNRLSHAPTGVKNLGSLVELQISNNRLTALRGEIMASLTKLRTLNAGYNYISLLPSDLSRLPNLRQLALHSNRLKQGSLTALLSNGLDEFDIVPLPRLSELQIQSNPDIASLSPLNGLVALRFVDAGGTQVTTMNDVKVTNIRQVHLSRAKRVAAAAVGTAGPMVTSIEVNPKVTVLLDGTPFCARVLGDATGVENNRAYANAMYCRPCCCQTSACETRGESDLASRCACRSVDGLAATAENATCRRCFG